MCRTVRIFYARKSLPTPLAASSAKQTRRYGLTQHSQEHLLTDPLAHHHQAQHQPEHPKLQLTTVWYVPILLRNTAQPRVSSGRR
jgi:hypothetical protein